MGISSDLGQPFRPRQIRGEGAEVFTCPYPLKFQARPPRDQRLATQSRVSGREGEKGAIVILKQLRCVSERLKNKTKPVNVFAQAKH